MPCLRSAGSCSLQTYQSRYGESGDGAGRLEPRVLVGGVVDDQVDDHLDAPVVGLVQQLGEVAERAQPRVDAVEVGRVVAVVVARRRVDRVQPQAGHARAGPGSPAGRSARGGRRRRRRRSPGTCRRRGSRRRPSGTSGHSCRRNISVRSPRQTRPAGGGCAGGVGYRAGHGERPRTAERTVGLVPGQLAAPAGTRRGGPGRRAGRRAGGGERLLAADQLRLRATTTARPCWRRCRWAPPWR